MIGTDISAAAYLDHIRADGERIGDAAEGHLDDAVPTCPGNTVGSLLLHTAMVCGFWTNALRQNSFPAPDWTNFPTDPIECHRTKLRLFVEEISARDPEHPTWVWGSEGRVRFWYRRAAQELSVHRWDVENTVGDPSPIDAMLAIDGIDEIATEFGPKSDHPDFKGASERFDGDGETLSFRATDISSARTLTMRPDRIEITDEATDADVVAHGTASDLLLLLWGRIPPTALDVNGDRTLLVRWQERVKL